MLAASQPVEAESFTVSVRKENLKQPLVSGLLSTLRNIKKRIETRNAKSSEVKNEFEKVTFTIWDTIKMQGTVGTITVSDIAELLESRFSASLQSISWGDVALFADYFDDLDQRLSEPLESLIKRSVLADIDDELSGDGFTDDRASQSDSGKATAERAWALAQQRGFIDLEVSFLYCSL